MKIINVLAEHTFENFFKSVLDKKSISENIKKFSEIVDFCNKNGEKLVCDKSYEFNTLHSNANINHDLKSKLIRILGKTIRQLNGPVDVASTKKITCTLGKHSEYAYDLVTYINCRQNILCEIEDLKEFITMFITCFPNTVFSDECPQEMQHIENLDLNRINIIKIMKFLDSNLLKLFDNYKENLKEIKTNIEASGIPGKYAANDSKHKKYLNFKFTLDDGSKKYIECQPHIKVGRANSNLRIYFYWRDSNIDNGNKILIGSIGRHPYKS